MVEKILCDCGNVATWCYMPGYMDRSNSYSCDDCVPRGCQCNHRYVDVNSYTPPLDSPELPTEEDMPIKWIEEGKVWCHVDENGREYPCCEYTSEVNGFEKYEKDDDTG